MDDLNEMANRHSAGWAPGSLQLKAIQILLILSAFIF
jgi:hypothetical protein